MRPYGVKVIQYPDVADIKEMGAKGSAGKFAGASGDFHPYNRNKLSKAATRRYWARKARRANRAACDE